MEYSFPNDGPSIMLLRVSSCKKIVEGKKKISTSLSGNEDNENGMI
jgi:hypothetical protein